MSNEGGDSFWLRGTRRDALAGRAPKRRLVGHYCAGDIECIDAIRSALGPEQFAGYCRGNAMKYLWRYPLKGTPVADLEKARTYLDWLIESLEEGGLCPNPTRNTE
jgi:hypothetical protein